MHYRDTYYKLAWIMVYLYHVCMEMARGRIHMGKSISMRGLKNQPIPHGIFLASRESIDQKTVRSQYHQI
jgi:hypothetical protein